MKRILVGGLVWFVFATGVALVRGDNGITETEWGWILIATSYWCIFRE